MAAHSQYEELARQLSAIGAVKREMGRMLPQDCPPASAGVLTLLDRHGEMRMSQLAELLAIDMSVTSFYMSPTPPNVAGSSGSPIPRTSGRGCCA